MSPKLLAVQAGLARGRIELRQALTNAGDLWNHLFPAVVFIVTMIFMRGAKVPGTDFSLGARTLPSVLGAGIAFSGLMTMAVMLTIEREDGTLLRAKAIPNGMIGYLVGKVVLTSGASLITFTLTLVPGLILFDGVAAGGLGPWLTLAWVVPLGLLATMPIGAIFGSLFVSPRSVGAVFFPLAGIIAVSGIFYPITSLPQWLQWLAQVFPVYWLGLGTRSALLPDALAAGELGGSWRHLETAGVLGVWAAVGLIVAPIVLRRMARRESGSSVAARREKAMQRVT
jgi:ABC-2 type transport system permease protein